MVTDCKTSGPPAAVMTMARCVRGNDKSAIIVMSYTPRTHSPSRPRFITHP